MKILGAALTFFSLPLVRGLPLLYAFLPTFGKRDRSRLFYKTKAHEFASHGETSHSRRRLLSLGGGALPLIAFADASYEEIQVPQGETLLADLPMIRLKLPKAAVGREYVAIKLTVDGKGPFDFMVDSGLTTELITPHLEQVLGRKGELTESLQELTAAGAKQAPTEVMKLTGAALCCGKFPSKGAGDTLPLPPLTAVVTDFPQEHIDPAHDPVEGMLGMEMLMMFDVDFDFPKGRLRLWAPGSAAAVASEAGMVQAPAAVLNETLLLGIRVTSTQAGSQPQPIIGILDCGSTFSAVNWAGAELLGLPPKNDINAYKGAPITTAIGVDGKPLYLPMKKVDFTYVGNPDLATKTFSKPPSPWKAWNPVYVGIGDLPVFSQMLGDGKTPFHGPAALIGLDVLSQRRLILETGKSVRRRVFIEPR